MKKNGSQARGDSFGHLKKILLKMKLTLLLILIGFVHVFAEKTYAQSTKLSMQLRDVSIVEVLKAIENQSEFYFVYNNESVNLSRKVSINAKGSSINDILDYLFKDTDISYKVIDRNIILSALQSELSQPTGSVRGVVKGPDGVPIPGVTVLLKGTTTGTITDSEGSYTLSNISANSVLIFSFVGMKPTEVKVGNQTKIDIKLQEETVSIDEVVAVGYTTQKREMVTGSAVKVKMKLADMEVPTTNSGNLLVGKVSGVNVSTPNGLPGSQPSISIRTASSLNSASALFVIDGKISNQTDFNNLSPNEIADVTVLKDAATTAAYGSRGAGGVIVVTTKKGTTGKATVTYSFNTGVDTRAKNMDLTDCLQWGTIYNRINGKNGTWNPADSTYYADTDLGGGKGYGFNLLKDVYRNPFMTTHNLSVQGGSEKIKYFVGGSYVKQQSFIQNTDYKKYNIRVNVNAEVTKDISIFGSFALNDGLQLGPNGALDGDWYTKSLVWQPYLPSFAANGEPFDFGWITNIAGELKGLSGYKNNETIKPTINLSGTYKFPFVKGLSATAGFIKSYTSFEQKLFSHPFQRYQCKNISPVRWDLNNITGWSWTEDAKRLERWYSLAQDKQLNLQLSYDRTFARHHVSGTLVYESWESKSSGMHGYINGFPLYITDQWWATTSAGVTNNTANKYVDNGYGIDNITGRRSWIGQFFYDFSGKYMVNFTYRYDGSMNFAPDKRWGFFPATSVGWIVSKENFMKNISWIDYLKFRATLGIIGNDALAGGSWQWTNYYGAANSAFFGTTPTVSNGIQYSGLSNPEVTWEKYRNSNIGIDLNFLKHFNSSLEYWRNYTFDILGRRIGTTPPTFSPTLPNVNYGTMTAHGVDLSISYSNSHGNLNYNIGLVASYGTAWRNQIDQNVTYDYQDMLKGGRKTSYVAGYSVDHMLRTQKDVDDWKAANPNYKFRGSIPEVGQFVYKDLASKDGVGKLDGVVDEYDITVLKKQNDPIVFGLNLGAEWKGLSINAVLNGRIGQSKWFNDLAGGVEWNRMWERWYDSGWTDQNTNAWLPRRYSANDGAHNWINTQGSNFWLADASFIRLKSLEVAYVIPPRFYNKYISNIRLFVSGSNLFIISKFNKKYYDPEMSSGTAFPIVKSSNVGCTFTF